MGSDGRMVPHRYTEQLPDGIKPGAARAHTLSILNAIKEGTFNPNAPAPVKLHAALDRYSEWSAANRPKSHAARATRIASLKAGISDMALDALSPWHVEAYKRRRLKQAKQRAGTVAAGVEPPTVKAATVNREVAALKHFLALAAAGAIEGAAVGPLIAAAIRDVSMLPEPPGRVRSLTPDEEKRLLAALADGLRPIVLVADATGMRRAEVARLRLSQVDLSMREIVLTRTKANNVRRVPVSDTIAPVLAAAVERAKAERKARPDAPETAPGYLFPSRRGYPYSLDAVSRGFARAVAAAGIEDLRFHDLRHDAATKARRSGHGLDVIRDLLGHADIKTTARYAHVDARQVRAAVGDIRPMAQPTAEEVEAAKAARKAKGKTKAKAKHSKARALAVSDAIAGPLPGSAAASGRKH